MQLLNTLTNDDETVFKYDICEHLTPTASLPPSVTTVARNLHETYVPLQSHFFPFTRPGSKGTMLCTEPVLSSSLLTCSAISNGSPLYFTKNTSCSEGLDFGNTTGCCVSGFFTKTYMRVLCSTEALLISAICCKRAKFDLDCCEGTLINIIL